MFEKEFSEKLDLESLELGSFPMDIKINGKIDLILEKDYKLYIVDYKTRQTPSISSCWLGKNGEDPSNVQLAFYTYLLEKQSEQIDVEEAFFISIVEGKDFSPEQYGIAFRKGSDATAAVNEAIAALMADGTMDKIGKNYKLDQLLIKDGKANEEEVTEGDLAYIKEKGKMTIGITLFAPMNYYDDNKELIGFETEFAKAVCEKLGVEAEFVEINWDTKEIELNAKSIDCIWNGMTITEERLANMSISVPYMQNKQVMVAK